MRNTLFALLIIQSLMGSATTEYKFRVWLKDKNTSSFSLNKPDQFLSQRALERRSKQSIAIDSTDLPVCKHYLDILSQNGLQIVTTSRWMNSAVVAVQDSGIMQQIRQLPFVKGSEWIWQGQALYNSSKFRNEMDDVESRAANAFEEYGFGLAQLAISNGQKLHQAGYKGEGKVIAIIDAGFFHADTISKYKNTTILGTKDFVTPGGNVFLGDKHGQSVLSIMAAEDSFHFIGAAPKASYWLLRSEDVVSEFPVEEDYWAAAAEFADSVGVDLINTSLGYTQFDEPVMDHNHNQLDGKTAFISRAAQMATNKGIFVVISAGNDGDKSWGKISFPADAADVLTVGAVNKKLQIASFSSFGYSADDRVKPDVVSVGEGTYLLDQYGHVNTSNGTSFSAPLMTGQVACLWQALPQFTNKQLLELIRTYSSFYTLPDIHYGYGVTDLWAAYQSATHIDIQTNPTPEIFFNNKKGNSITIRNLPTSDSIYSISVYTETGKMIFSEKTDSEDRSFNIKTLRHGFYIVFIEGANQHFTKKLVK
ncbi:MAG: S8 family serine peptidase [Bacteroidales bacterium]|nr:S8 family serine peptidase [Bacteroidales bacterium]